MLSADDIVAIIRPVLDRAESSEARRAALARLGGGEVPVEEQWPPDPGTIDIHDGSWVSVKTAAHLADNVPGTIYRRIADEDLAVYIGGKWWVNRARLLSGRRYPKATNDKI